jgi:hypothetical protein
MSALNPKASEWQPHSMGKQFKKLNVHSSQPVNARIQDLKGNHALSSHTGRAAEGGEDHGDDFDFNDVFPAGEDRHASTTEDSPSSTPRSSVSVLVQAEIPEVVFLSVTRQLQVDALKLYRLTHCPLVYNASPCADVLLASCHCSWWGPPSSPLPPTHPFITVTLCLPTSQTQPQQPHPHHRQQPLHPTAQRMPLPPMGLQLLHQSAQRPCSPLPPLQQL